MSGSRAMAWAMTVITPSLWMSSRAMDIAAHIPEGEDELAGLTDIFEENQETGNEE